MQCYSLLNINPLDIIPNRDVVPAAAPDRPYGCVSCEPSEILHPAVYEKLSVLGDLHGLVFQQKPHTVKSNIHIDIDTETQQPHLVSLNIILAGQGVMKWFKPSGEGEHKYIDSGKAHYLAWTKDYGEPICEWTHGKVALVRTDVAHNVWNPFDEERLLVTIRWKKRYSWEETLEWFKNNFPR